VTAVIVNLLGQNAVDLHVDVVMRDQVRRGPSVVLVPGRNEVDATWWNAWSEQNQGSGLMSMLRVEETEQ
jgi:hypothetical protein